MILPEPNTIAYQKYETYNNGCEMSKWETITKIGYDKVYKIVEGWEETYKHNEEIRKVNAMLYNKAIEYVQAFFKECEMDIYRYSSTNFLKKLGTTKEYDAFTKKLSLKYKTTPPIKPCITTIYFEKERISTASGHSLETLKSAKNEIERRVKIIENKTNNFKTALKVAYENQINIVDCATEKDVYNVVNEFMEERWVQENYPDGTEVYLKHACDECSTWIVGERRCSCGNRRITLNVEGDFIKGFYAYPEAY